MPSAGEGKRAFLKDFDAFSLRGVLILTALYGVVHALLRLIAGTNLAMDDPKENIFTQQLQWGYLPDNPPIFEWLLTLVQQGTGPTIFSFLIVKYALLVWSAGFFFLAGRRLYRDDRWSAITTYSAVLLYQIGWNYHQAFTHSLVTIAATCFSFWALIRMLQERRWQDYLLFGISVGLGFMSKYNFAGFLVVTGAPALLNRDFRQAALTWKVLPGLAAGLLVLSPHLGWVIAHRGLLERYADMKLGLDGSHADRVWEGLGDAIVAMASFYVPYLLVVAAIARGAFTRRKILDDPLMTLCRRSIIAAVAVILVGVIVFGVSNVTERYVVPFFLPGFFWLMARVRAAVAERGDGLWVKALAVAVVAMMALRIVNVGWGGEPVCSECWRWVPYAELKRAVAEEGFDPEGVYIGYEENTTGNLRRLFPKADVRSLNLLFYNPIRTRGSRECYFVWSEELLGQPVQEQFRYLTETDSTRIINAPWQHPFREKGWRHTQWGISPVPEDTQFYRNFCTDKPWP